MEFLRALIGTWEGEGVASYPTIDTFPYHEVLVVRGRVGDDTVIYEQQTWTPGERGSLDAPSHWETGFLVPQADGSVTALTAHDPRTEVLVGTPARSVNGVWRLELTSVSFLNDPRMAGDRRVLEVEGDELSYVMDMATDRVPEPTLHLEARLQRR